MCEQLPRKTTVTSPPLYLTAEQRRRILSHYGDKYHLRVFIETGTHTGDTPWALKDQFEQLYTIELDRELFAKAKVRFAKTPFIKALWGDSTVRLPEVLATVKRPCLIWLDGHYSGPGTAHGDLDTPIVQELNTIFADEYEHVILVDDARIFAGQPEHDDEPHYADYPSCEWVADLAQSHGYDFLLEDDIMRLTPSR